MTPAQVLSPALPYSHLDALTDAGGLFEHALLDVPRREHGYCVDDVARALIVVVQEPEQSEVTRRLTEQYLRFLERATAADGAVRNRVSAEGDSPEEPSLGDWWGRAVWAAGVVAARAELPLTRHRGSRLFLRLAARRSPHLRAMTSAVLGAVEVLAAHPENAAAAQLVADGSALLHDAAEADWPWPEPRLRYANGCVPEALLAAGAALGDPCCSPAASTSWRSCSRSSPARTACRSAESRAAAPARPARSSTSSRSRSRRSRPPAPAR